MDRDSQNIRSNETLFSFFENVFTDIKNGEKYNNHKIKITIENGVVIDEEEVTPDINFDILRYSNFTTYTRKEFETKIILLKKPGEDVFYILSPSYEELKLLADKKNYRITASDFILSEGLTATEIRDKIVKSLLENGLLKLEDIAEKLI